MMGLLTVFSLPDKLVMFLRVCTCLWLYTWLNVLPRFILGFMGKRLNGEFCFCFAVDSISGYMGKSLTGNICLEIDSILGYMGKRPIGNIDSCSMTLLSDVQ